MIRALGSSRTKPKGRMPLSPVMWSSSNRMSPIASRTAYDTERELRPLPLALRPLHGLMTLQCPQLSAVPSSRTSSASHLVPPASTPRIQRMVKCRRAQTFTAEDVDFSATSSAVTSRPRRSER